MRAWHTRFLDRPSMCLYGDRMAAEHEFPAGEGQARDAQASEGRDEAGRDEAGRAEVNEHPPPRRRKRWRLAVTAVTVSALALGAIVTDLSHSGTGVVYPLIDRTDRPAPAFSLPEVLVPSRQLTLADFRGRPLVLNFWASWCYPCQTEMPLLESAFRSARGAVQFIGVDTDDRRKAAAAFLARTHVSYVSLFMPPPGPCRLRTSSSACPSRCSSRHAAECSAATSASSTRPL